MVFIGGLLMFGSTGRQDLLGPEHAEALARHRHASAHRLVEALPDQTAIYPTHGSGSFCAATPTSGDSATIGSQRTDNPALCQGVDEWVEAHRRSSHPVPGRYTRGASTAPVGRGCRDERQGLQLYSDSLLVRAEPVEDPSAVLRRLDALAAGGVQELEDVAHLLEREEMLHVADESQPLDVLVGVEPETALRAAGRVIRPASS